MGVVEDEVTRMNLGNKRKHILLDLRGSILLFLAEMDG